MSLPPLKVKIGADTDDLEKGLGRASGIAKKFAVGLAGALTAVGTAMAAMTSRAMANADQLAKQARQVGLATDRLQAMSLVAGEAGVSTEKLTNTLGIMQRNIVELERGTATQVRAFESLGLSIRDLQGLEADAQFERIAASLNAVGDPATRTALAMEVFGRSGREAINMLEGYSDKIADATEFQRRFGIAISQTDAEQIERANDAVGRVREAFGGLANLMAVAVAPSVERVANSMISLAGNIADRVNPPTDRFKDIIDGFPASMDAAAGAAPGLEGAFGNIGSAASGAAEKVGLLSSALNTLAQRWAEGQAMGALVLNTPDGQSAPMFRLPPLPGGDGGALEDYLDSPPPINPGRPDVLTPDSGTTRPRAAPAMLGEPLAVPSIGGGGAVADQFARRLDALQEGLQTEAEVIDEWYQASVETLEEGLARKMMTEQEYLDARARLEEEYARRSNQIEASRQKNNFEIAADGMGQILGALGQGNEKIMRVSKAFNAGMAFIDTMAGAARELRKGTFGFASAAAVIAKGLGFVSAIQGAGSGGRGGVGGFSSASTGASSPVQAAPQFNIALDVIADAQGNVSTSALRGMVADMQNQLNRGARIIA